VSDENPTPRQNWITLGAASDLLGVSESTIRRWADAGDVRSFRTRGGHRRILEDDLRQIVSRATSAPERDTERISDLAIGRVKRRIIRGRQTHSLSIFEGLSPEVRDRLRFTGRQLVDLFARFVSSPSRGERFTEDARTVGHDYGRTLVSAGVGLASAITIFNSMRRSLEETASQIATESGLSTEAAVEAVEQTLDLADVVLEGMAEVYQEALSAR
jgi:excisionase family DNA binding protein